MSENLELIVMNLVVEAGGARSSAMEGVFHAREGDFAAAARCLDEADAGLQRAHSAQTDLIQQEARGERVALSLMLVHAQDHLMNATVVRDLARELIALHERLPRTQFPS